MSKHPELAARRAVGSGALVLAMLVALSPTSTRAATGFTNQSAGAPPPGTVSAPHSDSDSGSESQGTQNQTAAEADASATLAALSKNQPAPINCTAANPETVTMKDVERGLQCEAVSTGLPFDEHPPTVTIDMSGIRCERPDLDQVVEKRIVTALHLTVDDFTHYQEVYGRPLDFSGYPRHALVKGCADDKAASDAFARKDRPWDVGTPAEYMTLPLSRITELQIDYARACFWAARAMAADPGITPKYPDCGRAAALKAKAAGKPAEPPPLPSVAYFELPPVWKHLNRYGPPDPGYGTGDIKSLDDLKSYMLGQIGWTHALIQQSLKDNPDFQQWWTSFDTNFDQMKRNMAVVDGKPVMGKDAYGGPRQLNNLEVDGDNRWWTPTGGGTDMLAASFSSTEAPTGSTVLESWRRKAAAGIAKAGADKQKFTDNALGRSEVGVAVTSASKGAVDAATTQIWGFAMLTFNSFSKGAEWLDMEKTAQYLANQGSKYESALAALRPIFDVVPPWQEKGEPWDTVNSVIQSGANIGTSFYLAIKGGKFLADIAGAKVLGSTAEGVAALERTGNVTKAIEYLATTGASGAQTLKKVKIALAIVNNTSLGFQLAGTTYEDLLRKNPNDKAGAMEAAYAVLFVTGGLGFAGSFLPGNLVKFTTVADRTAASRVATFNVGEGGLETYTKAMAQLARAQTRGEIAANAFAKGGMNMSVINGTSSAIKGETPLQIAAAAATGAVFGGLIEGTIPTLSLIKDTPGFKWLANKTAQQVQLFTKSLRPGTYIRPGTLLTTQVTFTNQAGQTVTDRFWVKAQDANGKPTLVQDNQGNIMPIKPDMKAGPIEADPRKAMYVGSSGADAASKKYAIVFLDANDKPVGRAVAVPLGNYGLRDLAVVTGTGTVAAGAGAAAAAAEPLAYQPSQLSNKLNLLNLPENTRPVGGGGAGPGGVADANPIKGTGTAGGGGGAGSHPDPETGSPAAGDHPTARQGEEQPVANPAKEASIRGSKDFENTRTTLESWMDELGSKASKETIETSLVLLEEQNPGALRRLSERIFDKSLNKAWFETLVRGCGGGEGEKKAASVRFEEFFPEFAQSACIFVEPPATFFF